MNDLQPFLASIILPTLGWAWWVERRLATLQAVSEKIDKLDKQVDRIVDHLIKDVK